MSNSGFLRRPRPRTVFCALLALAVSGAAALQAASTGFWVVATQSDCLKGDTDAVSIDTDGRVTIAPALQVLGEVGTPAVWRIAAELDLQALAAGPQGSVLVGSAPDGKVYRVAADGSTTTFFDPEDKYIWAI